MNYSIKLVKKNEQATNLWSGGKTTQLAIYPEDADYSKRNFQWRISTADVEVEASLFTHLPGIQRVIMIIDGEMYLEHEGKHSVVLKPFEQDRFEGGWTTRSKGIVKDFNLMLSNGCDGGLTCIQIKKDIQDLVLDATGTAEVFYCVDGMVRVEIGEEEPLFFEKGDILSIIREKLSEEMSIKFCNKMEKNLSIIRATIVD
ncbi:HutD/Ves family protein [Neobacillus ginsengisoli]|uniref:Environmental stress-induced protein Ves n=1 Tax=Neobacillus ginsengisoli TaxID=904295 RepID=A0ABT9Y0Y6_9BACI|nr:HutD family protein [Neobacillus ginsengisoli]MDQ0201298.1 environmental stress-induced protein Ves [Neobacillus ginsengisoli]